MLGDGYLVREELAAATNGDCAVMTLIVSTLAVAVAAFCVWLTVRIVNRKERWAKWTLAAAVGMPVLYVASFGPASWIYWQKWCPQTAHFSIGIFYAPAQWLLDEGPRPVRVALTWYCCQFNGPDDPRLRLRLIRSAEEGTASSYRAAQD
ncbi:MAG: hypothetical protein HY290_33755 [Planctomycetia bacterium]|nr:hypothetical protein [Planctomycetia bacterium]